MRSLFRNERREKLLRSVGSLNKTNRLASSLASEHHNPPLIPMPAICTFVGNSSPLRFPCIPIPTSYWPRSILRISIAPMNHTPVQQGHAHALQSEPEASLQNPSRKSGLKLSDGSDQRFQLRANHDVGVRQGAMGADRFVALAFIEGIASSCVCIKETNQRI